MESASALAPSVVLKTMSTSPLVMASTICGPPFQHLVDPLAGDAVRVEMALGAARGEDAEAHLGRSSRDRGQQLVLVAVLHRDENGAREGSFAPPPSWLLAKATA